MARSPGNKSGIPVISGLVLTYIFTCILAEDFTHDFTGATDKYLKYDVMTETESTGDAPLKISFSFREPANAKKMMKVKEVLFYTDSLMVYRDMKLLYYEISASDDTAQVMVHKGKGVLDMMTDWHDVSLELNKDVATLTVDGVMSYEYFGVIPKLATGSTIYLGRNKMDSNPFKGCLTNFKLKEVNLQSTGGEGNLESRIAARGCPLFPDLMSFSGTDSYIDVGIDLIKNLEAVVNDTEWTFEAQFRTTESVSTSLLKITLEMDTEIRVALHSNGHNLTVMYGDRAGLTEAEFYHDKVMELADGHFHKLLIHVYNGTFGIQVDDNTMEPDEVTIDANKPELNAVMLTLGGYPESPGFRGCMSALTYGLEMVDLTRLINMTTDVHSVVFGTCQYKDRCQYDTCAHEAKCTNKLQGETVKPKCQCTTTAAGYEGHACLSPIWPFSCEKVTFSAGETERPKQRIDLDGAGPMQPMTVACVKDSKEKYTRTRMSAIALTDITTYPLNVTVDYAGVTRDQLIALTERSKQCSQEIQFDCKGAPLMKKLPGQDVLPHGYWVDRNAMPHYSWGATTDYMCGTGEGTACNCDTDPVDESGGFETDNAVLTDKDDLPVTRLIFDNGTADSSDWQSKYLVKPMECRQDYHSMEDWAITFKQRMSVLPVKVPHGGAPTYFSLEFKTTQKQACLLHSEIITLGRKKLYFRFNIETKKSLSLTVMSEDINISWKQSFPSFVFSNNLWHTVYFEINHQSAFILVNTMKHTLWTSADMAKFVHYPKLYPTERLFIGGAPDGSNGYVGCIRNLYVGGMFVDLASLVRDANNEGISTGCVGQCDSKPCLNDGNCNEYYNTFTCDCSSSSYQGCYCGKYIGVSLSENITIQYTLTSDGVDFPEVLSLGFRTMMNSAALVKLENTSAASIIIELVSGELSVYNGGADASNKFNISGDFNDDKFHTISLMEIGAMLSIKVDKKDDQNISGLQLPTTPTVLILGKTDNDMGYEGCLYLVKYRNHTLLNKAVTNPVPSDVRVTNAGAITTIEASEECSPEGDMPAAIKTHAIKLMEVKEKSQERTAARRPPTIKEFKVETREVLTNFREDTSSTTFSAISAITLSCPSEGSPAPWTIWRKGFELCPHLRLGDVGDKLILPPEELYYGSYACEPSNTWGKATTTNVAFRKPEIMPFTKVEKSVSLEEGSFLELECPDVDSVPPASTEWSISGNNIDMSASRIHVSATGDLVILWTLLADDAKVYSCFRLNPYTEEKVLVINYTLTVTVAADGMPSIEPEIRYITPSPHNVTAMSDVVLQCLATASDSEPIAKVSWYRRGEDKELEPIDEYGRTLRLWKVTEADAGTYQCKMTTNTNIMKEVTVNVELEPILDPKLTPKTVYAGKEATFTCGAIGETDYAVTWVLNGQPFTESTNKYVLSDSNTSLTIKNASKDTDLMTVLCTVTVREWRLFSQGYLNVYDPMKLIPLPMKGGFVSHTSKDFTLTVKVKVDPGASMTFTWYKGTTPHMKALDLKPENKPLIQLMEVTEETKGSESYGKLTFHPDQMTNKDRETFAGKYLCVVFDGVGDMTFQREMIFQSEQEEGLSTGAIVGIVVGCIVGFTLIAFIIAYIIYSRKSTSKRYPMNGANGAYKNPAYAE